MRSRKFQARRYQLKKESTKAIQNGHPWVYHDSLSSGVEAFPDGQWLQLFDSQNTPVGYGVFEQEGVIGIRVYKRGETAPDTKWFEKQIDKALAKRQNLLNYTNGFRAIHGENDGFPGIVVDIYDSYGVLQTYSPTVDSLGRWVFAVLAKKLNLQGGVWKMPAKRKRKSKKEVRLLFGDVPKHIKFREGKSELCVDPWAGQKSGVFLDLRGLRKWVGAQKLSEKRVLNLFSYTCTLGFAAEMAQAKEVWNVDVSDGALTFGKMFHTKDRSRQKWIAADIFEWLKTFNPKEKFDLIIVDPPMMASSVSQVPQALKAYRKLYELCLPRLKSQGTMAVCCCTSRIARKRFQENANGILLPHCKLIKELGPEDDHPVGFPEGDYLKLLLYRLSR